MQVLFSTRSYDCFLFIVIYALLHHEGIVGIIQQPAILVDFWMKQNFERGKIRCQKWWKKKSSSIRSDNHFHPRHACNKNNKGKISCSLCHKFHRSSGLNQFYSTWTCSKKVEALRFHWLMLIRCSLYMFYPMGVTCLDSVKICTDGLQVGLANLIVLESSIVILSFILQLELLFSHVYFNKMILGCFISNIGF